MIRKSVVEVSKAKKVRRVLTKVPTEPYASWRKRRGEKKTHLSDLAHVGASGIGRRQDCRKGNQGGEHLLSIHLERYVWFRGESPPLLVIIIYFFSQQTATGFSTSAVVTFHHVLPSIPRYNAFTTLLLLVYENRGKERGTSSPLELDQHFRENSVAVRSAGSAEIGGRRERRETTGGRCRGSGEGEKDKILSSSRGQGSGREFALCWTSFFLLLLLKTS